MVVIIVYVEVLINLNKVLFESIFLGLNLVESFPYETVQRDYDYVRLASITAGKMIFLPFILIYTVLSFMTV